MAIPSHTPKIILSQQRVQGIINKHRDKLMADKNIKMIDLGYYTDKRFNRYYCMKIYVEKYIKGIFPHEIDNLPVCIEEIAK